MGMKSRDGVINYHSFVFLFLALTHTYPSSAFSSSSKNHTQLCRPSQRDALLRFKDAYNRTGGQMTKWDEHVDCCRWDWIKCDKLSGDVISVHVVFSELVGTINYITSLSPLYNLQELNLRGNHLHGVVPPEFSHFSKLKSLHLGLNQELTIESYTLKLLLQNLTQLEFLDLTDVKISGDPFNALVNISSPLTVLRLSACDLHGVFPESIFHLPNLYDLRLRDNRALTISFPSFNWSSSLEVLDLSSTNFFGKFPDSIGNLKNLAILRLLSLHFSNALPSSMKNLTGLTSLSLSSFSCRDAIPSSVCHLSSLEKLYLPHNNFTGMVPQCLGNLTKLNDLDLSHNQLIGLSSPSPSANFTKLLYLFVRSNKINDTITHWLQFFPNLNVIDVETNNFHGEIPPSICSHLVMVDLSNNRLTGTIPSCLNGTNILNLRGNMLEGTIPNTYPLNCAIMELDLSENRLEGPLPSSMVNCHNLRILNLGSNSLEDYFPNWLETLPELQVLVLNFNKLHGVVKPLRNHHPFPKLSILDISNNNFFGLLPAEYIAQFDAMKDITSVSEFNIYLGVPSWKFYGYSTTITIKGSICILPKVLIALKLMDFSNNHFDEEIPKIIGSLVALKGLNLSHNNLIGNIPSSIQNMVRLEWLDLSLNKLTGQIPNGLAQLTELGSLNLSHNELMGKIPTGKQFDTFGKDCFVGNAELCGSQIAIACGKPHAPHQPPFPHIQEDGFNSFDWNIILMGFGCGFVIGLSLGYICFELQRPKWFMSLVEEKLLKKIMMQRRRANKLCRT